MMKTPIWIKSGSKMKLEKEAHAWGRSFAKKDRSWLPIGFKRPDGRHRRPGNIFGIQGAAGIDVYKISQDSATQGPPSGWKERNKSVIFDYMSVYVENPKESTENGNGGILPRKWETCSCDSCP